jgi:hypothetical protein
MTGTWEFSIAHGHTRTEDGLRVEWSHCLCRTPCTESCPDWVWVVHRAGAQPVWVDPVKRGVEEPADMRRYVDERWPLVPTEVQR